MDRFVCRRPKLPPVIDLTDEDGSEGMHTERSGRSDTVKSQEGTGPVGRINAKPHGELQGQFLVEDFISEEEEAAIVKFLDSDEGVGHVWKLGHFNGPSYRKHWGVETDLRLRTFSPPKHNMPELFRPLAERIRQVTTASSKDVVILKQFHPNEANAIDYRRDEGHHLLPHCDDRQLSGTILCNLCLCGDAVMTYREDNKRRKRRRGACADEPATYDVRLPRRSLQIQSGRVRYDFQHSIARSGLLSPRRVSITFRHNAYSGHHL
eukprot:TRINITY_DN84123_c0_g1_i1.p1 TRINITY_DN84123_c0_g1~~TRINITY_DN84123_c0_g1_i1.p1  ORF type:complete len:286 (-),score=44.37 TRINITY_DN84123_c0_g1_i1:56-850(-)